MTLWKTSDGVSLDALAEEATVSDLVEALRDHGDVLMADELERHPGLANLRVPPGRYLVVPLGEDA